MNFNSILKKLVKSSLKRLSAEAKPESSAKKAVLRNKTHVRDHFSIMQVMNDARQDVIESNADDTTQMEYLATLDSHTCIKCATRDGLRWYVKSKKPVGHTLDWQAPPIHVGCRCTILEVTILSDMIEGGRASQFGVVSGKMTFGEFLKQRDIAFQDGVLGKDRAKIWRSKQLSLRDLVDESGRELTLDELRAKYCQ